MHVHCTMYIHVHVSTGMYMYMYNTMYIHVRTIDLDGGSKEVDVPGGHLSGGRHSCTVARGGKEV